MLNTLVRIARQEGFASLLLTFSPHPERVLGHRKTLMIQTLEQRLEEVEKEGVDNVLVTPFDRRFSSLPPEEFIQVVLLDRLRAKALVVGHDFRFGEGRSGTVDFLKDRGKRLGFRVRSVPPVKRNGQVVSSSLIRRLLGAGKVEEAAPLLAREYEITGRVVPGRSMGKTLGFPTANIASENEILPPGVFLTQVEVREKTFSSLTNVGIRPTFGRDEIQVESYLFLFRGDLYGERVRVRFLHRIRPERKFKTADSLKRRVQTDMAAARAFFRLPPDAR